MKSSPSPVPRAALSDIPPATVLTTVFSLPPDAAPDARTTQAAPHEPAAGGADDHRGRPSRDLSPVTKAALDDSGRPLGLEVSQSDHVLDEKLGLVQLLLHKSFRLLDMCGGGGGDAQSR